MTRAHVSVLLGGMALAACAADAERATSDLTVPLREGLLTMPLACTEAGPAVEVVMRTEEHGVHICPGFVRWDEIDGLRLDVDRYGTIVEIEIDPRPVDARDVYNASERDELYRRVDPYWLRTRVVRLRGRVTAVLKGAAPLGHAEFPIATVGRWSLGIDINVTRDSMQGGWPLMRIHDLSRGLVFLPTGAIRDNILLGCAEGHIVWIGGDAGETYVRDVRRIGALDRAALSGANAPALIASLREEGGMMLGFFVAEHARVEETLGLLERTPEVGPFDRGLYRGILRMRELVATGEYPAPAWHGASLAEVEARIDRWASDRAIAPWSIDTHVRYDCNASGEPSESMKFLTRHR